MKHMRAFWLMLLLSLSLFCVTVAYCAALFIGNGTPARQALAETALPQTEQVGEAYLLCIEDGEVRVRLTDGTSLPTGVQAVLLPQSDRSALEQGIPVHSRQALTALLEDLGA